MNNFARVAILSTILATGVVGVLWFTGVLAIRSDDDKPPVVVSGGSVIIEQQVDAMDDKRGNFEEVVAGNKKKWRAGHSGKKPKYLTIIIDNSTTAATECQPTYVHKQVTSLTFTYKPTVGVDTPFTAAIVDEALQFDFPGDAEQKAGTEFRLTIPEATLISVTIGTTTCDLGPRGRVELRQRKS